MVVRQSRVQETLQSASFLHCHRELRRWRRVELVVVDTGGNSYRVASRLLARAVTIDPESESASVILLRNIHAFSFLLFACVEGAVPSNFYIVSSSTRVYRLLRIIFHFRPRGAETRRDARGRNLS